MAVFKRGFKKIIWLNPNLKYDNYQPLCMGMAAAISYTDYFLPCHNLKTLEKFIEIVKKYNPREVTESSAEDDPGFYVL